MSSLKKINFFSFLFSIFFCLTYLSCSDNEPRINSVSGTVVFSFNDNESEADIRFSVFAGTESDFLRVKKIKAINDSTGLLWECNEVRKITDNEKKSWVGYSNFKAAENESIPKGRYTFIYEDLSEKEAEASFYITYPDKYLGKKASDFPAVIDSSKTTKYALYNNENDLIYYGDKKRAWTDNSKILNEYKNAVLIRQCFITNGNSVAILMPPEKINDTKSAENLDNGGN